jgi:hypothetical protein
MSKIQNLIHFLGKNCKLYILFNFELKEKIDSIIFYCLKHYHKNNNVASLLYIIKLDSFGET